MDPLLRAINEWYTEGNASFKLREYDRAIQSYSSALLHTDYRNSAELNLQLLLLKCRLNRSQCFLKTDSYCDAVADCTYIISYIDDTSCDDGPSLPHDYLTKSLIRRAQAHECLGNYSKAIVDVDRILTNSLPGILMKSMISLRSRLRSSLALDRSLSVTAGRPFAMVTDQQALRLTFLHQLPLRVALMRPHYVRLSVTNELGLWNRDLFQGRTSNSSLDAHLNNTEICVECELHPVAATSTCTSELDPLCRVVMRPHRCSSRNGGAGIELGADGKVT